MKSYLRKSSLLAIVSAGAISLSAAWGGIQSASAAEDSFYNDKTIQLIVPHGAGGGFDTYARGAAPYLEKYLDATVVVKNVTGAGGNIGRNQLYRATPDGLVIGFSSFPSMIFSQLSGADGVQFDVGNWNILGRVVAESEVISVPKGGKYQTLEELMNAQDRVRIPLSGVGDDTFFKAMILAKALDIDVVPVTGYDGTSEAFAAAMRGDGEILSSSMGSSYKLIESGEIKPVLQISLVPDSQLEDIPLASDVIEDQDMKRFIQSIANIAALDRSFFAPPGVPEERLQELQDAVSKSLQDPGFLADMQQGGREVDFMSGEEATKLLQGAMADADDLAPLLQEALAKAQ